MLAHTPVLRRAALATATALLIAGLAAAIDTRETAPRFRAKSLDGEQFSNESLKGKVVLLQFWATWCGFCRRDQPAVDAIVHDFESQGLVVLAVNVGESKSKVKKYLQDSPRACKIVATEDTNLAALFEAHAYPLYVLIDRDGTIAGTQRGAGGLEALRELLAKAGLKSE
jgi:thiol-disulfide isomerase/thioredoxin